MNVFKKDILIDTYLIFGSGAVFVLVICSDCGLNDSANKKNFFFKHFIIFTTTAKQEILVTI